MSARRTWRTPERGSVSSVIDKVLRDAVGSGAVPDIAAVVADRSGAVYRGAAGPKIII